MQVCVQLVDLGVELMCGYKDPFTSDFLGQGISVPSILLHCSQSCQECLAIAHSSPGCLGLLQTSSIQHMN